MSADSSVKGAAAETAFIAAARLRWAFTEYVNDCHNRGALSFFKALP